MDLNPSAPVVGFGVISIDAPVETTWEVLSDVARWPSWNPAIKAVAMQGPLEIGTAFRWKSSGFTISSRLEVLEAPSSIGWKGTMPGISARHLYLIEPTATGSRVRTVESWKGPLPTVLKRSLTKLLNRSIDSGLRCLKAEAERRASEPM